MDQFLTMNSHGFFLLFDLRSINKHEQIGEELKKNKNLNLVENFV